MSTSPYPMLANGMAFSGIDPHTGLMPGEPPVPVLAPHVCGGRLEQIPSDRVIASVLSPGGDLVERGHDVGAGILHVAGPPSLPAHPFLPIIIATSSSKAQFGASAVLSQGPHPVAFAYPDVAGLLSQCGDYFVGAAGQTGVGVVLPYANSSVLIGATGADIVGGWTAWAWDMGKTALFDKLYPFGIKKLFGEIEGLLLKKFIESLLQWMAENELPLLGKEFIDPKIIDKILNATSSDEAFEIGHDAAEELTQ